MRKVLGAIIISVCSLMIVWFALPMFGGIVNIGNVAGISAFAFIIAAWALFPALKTKTARRIYYALCSLFICCVIYGGVLSGLMISAILDTPQNADNTVVVVLGCKVIGKNPSRIMTKRLEAANAYLEANEAVQCIVTGGQGDDEITSEAIVMAEWLKQQGISSERIITENQATDTAQNIAYSTEIAAEMGAERLIIVSDGFHLYRAKMYADRLGIEADCIAGQSDWAYVPTYWVREWFGITAEILGI